MTTPLPVAVAIDTSRLPPPRDQYFSRAASASCWYGRSSNMAIMDGRRLPKCAGQTLRVINAVRAREPDQRVPAWLFLPLTQHWSRLPVWSAVPAVPAVPALPTSPPTAKCARFCSCPGKRLACPVRCEPNAHRLEQKDLGVFHLFVDTKRVAQILQGLAADRLRLLTGVQVRDPLPNLPAFVIAFDDLPSQGEVIAVA